MRREWEGEEGRGRKGGGGKEGRKGGGGREGEVCVCFENAPKNISFMKSLVLLHYRTYRITLQSFVRLSFRATSRRRVAL